MAHTDGGKAPRGVRLEVVRAHLAQLLQQRPGHGLLASDVAHLLEVLRKVFLLALVDAHEPRELHATRGLQQPQTTRHRHRRPLRHERAALERILHERAVPRRSGWRGLLVIVTAEEDGDAAAHDVHVPRHRAETAVDVPKDAHLVEGDLIDDDATELVDLEARLLLKLFAQLVAVRGTDVVDAPRVLRVDPHVEQRQQRRPAKGRIHG